MVSLLEKLKLDRQSYIQQQQQTQIFFQKLTGAIECLNQLIAQYENESEKKEEEQPEEKKVEEKTEENVTSENTENVIEEPKEENNVSQDDCIKDELEGNAE